jgi:hypothetical protein
MTETQNGEVKYRLYRPHTRQVILVGYFDG